MTEQTESSSVKGVGPSGPAPNPSVDFAGFVAHMTASLDASTTLAASFPEKSDLNFHRTLDRKFARGLDSTSERLLTLTDRLLQLAVDGSQDKGKGRIRPRRRKIEDEDDVVDSFRAGVVDVVDGLLERADSNLDEINGQKKKAAIELKPSLIAQAGKKLPGPFQASSSKVRLPGYLVHASSLPKPQLQFRDPVDNSISRPAWRPTLTTKPHSMVPLGFVIPSEDEPSIMQEEEDTPQAALRREREARAKFHPYYYETKHLPYPTSMFTSTPPQPPRSFEDTPFEFINTPDRLAELVDKLKLAKEIAVDLEHHNMRSYEGFTCLLQLSTRDGDWVIDTLALRGELRDHKLGGVFTDPAIVKIFHGADSDIVWLQQDFDIYVVNLFDTYHATKVLGFAVEFPQFSLASLLQLYCDFEADKRYQMADWRIRPIPDEMLFYARSDTHFLLYIYDSLRNALLARSSRTPSPAVDADASGVESTPKPNPQRAMREVLERSAETALKLYERDEYDGETGKGSTGWSNLAKKLGKKEILNEQVGWVFKRLHAWRDNLARQLDESPHYVLPNHLLIQLSHLRPKNVAVLGRTIAHQSKLALDWIDAIAKIITDAVHDFDAHAAVQATQGDDVEMQQAGVVADASMPVPYSASVTPPVNSESANVLVIKRARTSPQPVDVWSQVISGHAPAESLKMSSSLFGNTLRDTPPVPSVAPILPRSTSSLFGNTLSNKFKAKASLPGRLKSPGFEAVQQTIHASFMATPSEPRQVDNISPSVTIEPETVPFVPRIRAVEAAVSIATTPKVELKETKPTLPVDGDGIVLVKKRKVKKDKKPKNDTSDGVSLTAETVEVVDASSSLTPVTVADRPSEKRVKVKAEDIPTFDYSAEPSLLDRPKPKLDPKTKKNKGKKANNNTGASEGGTSKGKKGKPATDTSYRRPPSDPSQPKSGNRSGTFM